MKGRTQQFVLSDHNRFTLKRRNNVNSFSCFHNLGSPNKNGMKRMLIKGKGYIFRKGFNLRTIGIPFNHSIKESKLTHPGI